MMDPKDDPDYMVRFRHEYAHWVWSRMYGSAPSLFHEGLATYAEKMSVPGADIHEFLDSGLSVDEIPALKEIAFNEGFWKHDHEKVAVRVLNQDASMFTLNSIGLTKKQKEIIEVEVTKPSGMILMCGPTGSGKTTTLYAMLNSIDFFQRNVVTVEDPVEYVMPNMSQIEVNTKAGITFGKSLRSILRQDPDVICIGEIRDEETAKIALQASQTGHLVLATIHSNSSASALVRLLDLGISPMLLSSGMSLIVSQRLVRKLCKYCREQAQLAPNQIRYFQKKKINYANIMQAVGCEHCHNTGYYDRIAVYDLLALDDTLKASISDGTLSIPRLRKEGDIRGKSNLQKQGFLNVVTGVTSLKELDRALG